MEMTKTSSSTSVLRRAITWLLVILMVVSLIPAPQARAVSGTTVAADGTYTGSGTVSFSKDDYTFDVTLTVSGGKITNITSELTSTPEESKSKSKYHPNAVTAILKNLNGKDATYSNIDGVSSGTPKYSYAALKKALLTAISNAPAAAAAQTYTVTWKSQDGVTTLETDTKVTAGTQPSYDGTTPTKANTSTTIYNFAGWATKTGQTSGTAANKLPAVTANVTYYAAFSEQTVSASNYQVTWCNYDGSEIKTTSVKNGDKPVFGDADPVKPGDTENEYTFAGWATSKGASSGTPEGSLPAVTGAVTYYAAFAQPAGVSPRTISIADGTYVNSSADVTTRDYTYNPVTTIVVSGGKITSITSEMLSDNAINQLRHKRATQEISSALVGQKVDNVDTLLQLLADLNPDSDSSESLADAVSGATLSTYALLNEIKVALCGTLVNPSASAKTKNPTAVTSNGITLEKTLTYNNDGTYDVTLKAYAVQGEGTSIPGSSTTNYVNTEMWPIAEAKAYTYATLNDGKHYYAPNSSYAYLLKGLVSGSNYYIVYEDGSTTYYLNADGSTSTTATNAVTGTGKNVLKAKSFTSNSNVFTTVDPNTGSGGGSTTTTYTMDGYKKDYKFSDLQSGKYYYLYNGTYYQVNALSYKDKKSDTRYVGYFTIGSTKYYLDKTPQAYTDEQLKEEKAGDKDPSKAYSSCKESDVSKGEKLPLYTATTTTSGGSSTTVSSVWRQVPNGTTTTDPIYTPGGKTKLGTDAVLMDVVNLISWDASRAEISATTKTITMNPSGVVTEGSETANSLTTSAMSEDGVIEVTGFDYRSTAVAKGGSGEELVLTIKGIRPTRAGDYVASNALDVYGQNAGVFDGSTQVVDIVSPLAKVLETDVAEVYTPTESGSVNATTNYYGTVTVDEGSTMNFSNCTFYEHVYVDGIATFTNCTFRAGMTTTGSSTVTNCTVYCYGQGNYNYSYIREQDEDNANYFFNSLLNDKDGQTALSNVTYYGVNNAPYKVSTNALKNATSGVAYSDSFNAVTYSQGQTGKEIFISAEPIALPDGVSAATNKTGSSLTVSGTPNTVGNQSFTLKLGDETKNDTVIYYIPVYMNITDRAATPVNDGGNNKIDYAEDTSSGDTSKKDNGIYLNKTLTERSDGLYDLTLEAYTTGAVFSETYTAPADIVLVLDQSASMSKSMTGSSSRLAALKSSVTTFVGEIQKNAVDQNLDHRIAIVGFASDYNTSYKNYPNTELLIGNQQINYEDATKANYASALLPANVNGAVNSQITTAINNVTASGQTYANFGMMMAKNVLQNRTETTFVKDGKTMPRRTVVIFFTDGCPGNPAYTFFSEDYDSISVANETILRSAELTAIGATIYTVGIFDGAGSTADTSFQYGTDYSFYYAGYGSSWIFEHAYYPGENAANAFLHYISSDYPNARSMEDAGVPAPEMYAADGTYTGYYYTAANMTALTNAFKDISVEVTRPIMDLNNTAVLYDELTENFEVTKDTVVTATAHAVSGYADGAYTFYNQSSQTLTANLDGKIVTVSGFDYDSNFLYKDANGAYHGSKLVVTIPALLPKVSGQGLDSNTAESGIYADVSDIEAGRPAVAYFPKPNTDIPHYTRIADFDVNGTIVAEDVERMRDAVEQEDGSFVLQGRNGTFTLTDGTVTYTMQRNLHQFGTNIDLTVSGVDIAYVYGKHKNATGEEFGYREGYAKWQQINVVPGTSIYFDDSYETMNKGFTTDGVTELDDAYLNAAINAASINVDPVMGENETGSKRIQFLFSGSRIDIYCTTETTSGSVTVVLYRGNEINKDNKLQSFVMNNKAETMRANIPTISFDASELDPNYEQGQEYLVVIVVSAKANYKLDAVRVYNPISQDTKFVDEKGTEKTVGEVYADAQEQNAVFTQVRKILLNEEIAVDTSALFPDSDSIVGTLYFESGKMPENSTIVDQYKVLGPKNEVYLKSGNSVAFQIQNLPTNGKVMIGVSAPEVDENQNVKASKVKVTWEGKVKEHDINTVVDQYYAVTPNGDGSVVIQNTGDNLISITNVKITGDLVQKTNDSTDPDAAGATILSVASAEAADTETLQPKLVVSRSLLNYVETFDTLEVVDLNEAQQPEPTETPAPTSTPEPEPSSSPEPTPTPDLAQMLQNMFSAFVRSLFGSISRLFGGN